MKKNKNINDVTKIYRAYATRIHDVIISECTIKEVDSDGVWTFDDHEREDYIPFDILESEYGKTKQEAIKKRIGAYKKYIKEYKSMIEALEQEKEKINGN